MAEEVVAHRIDHSFIEECVFKSTVYGFDD